jgi:hypothetical protein
VKSIDLVLIEMMPLEEVQDRLRLISGSPLRSKDDAIYRRELWQRLDRLVRDQDAQ